MSRTRLRVATVGTGYFARFHHAAWARIEAAELVAVCDRDRLKAADLATRFGGGDCTVYDDVDVMLAAARPDLLDIITPPASHAALVRKAADAGVDVVCQKAFCTSLEEARAVVRDAATAGITLLVHENFRFQPWYRAIARELAGGSLGDLYQATFRLRPGDGQGPEAYLDRQPYFRTMERFLIHETGIHFIDTFRFLFGEPAGVYADLRRLNPAIRGEDAGLFVFDFAGGMRAVFDGNRLSDHRARNRRLTMGEFLIEGARGALRLDGDGCLWFRPIGQDREQGIACPFDGDDFGGGSVLALQTHVVRHLAGEGPAENTGEAYLANLAIEEMVYRAARERRRIGLG